MILIFDGNNIVRIYGGYVWVVTDSNVDKTSEYSVGKVNDNG